TPPAGRDPADSRPASGGPALRSLLVRVAHVLGLSSPWPLHRDPSGPCPYDRGVRLGRSSADSPTAAERRPACLRSLKAGRGFNSALRLSSCAPDAQTNHARPGWRTATIMWTSGALHFGMRTAAAECSGTRRILIRGVPWETNLAIAIRTHLTGRLVWSEVVIERSL